MNKPQITEAQPLSYTAHDGTRIEIRLAGPECLYTLTVGGRRIITNPSEADVRELAYRYAVAHNARAARSAELASPLVEGERQCSGLAGGGTAANHLSAPVREMLAEAACTGSVARGRLQDGCYPLTMLKAAARRGWLVLDHDIRPSLGYITVAGHKALSR